jgi:DNA-binding Xre family transcriptional regulator
MLTKLEATNKVIILKEKTNVNKLADNIGISKMTLYTRLKKMNWKKPELFSIERL